MFIGKSRLRFHGFLLLAGIGVLCGLLACSPPAPIRVGFVGGLSGRVADLSVEARNGAALAVELRNKAGGVHGRRVELLVEDDQQSADQLRRSLTRLIELKVEAVIGPMTSAMAMLAVPLANEAQLLIVAPTVSTKTLSGIDDYFFRVVAATDVHASANAEYHFNKAGLRRVAVAYDLNNGSYSQSWLAEYSKTFVALGGQIVDRVGFASRADVRFAELARQLLTSRPDGVLIIANSVDAAMICQHVRKLDASVQLAASEWAATEQLIELGGRAVEGVLVAQLLDRDSTQKPYLDFRAAYAKRFGKVPGFGGLTGFDAANVVLEAMAQQTAGQTLKQTLLARRTFSGAQGPVVFDAYGDTARTTYLTTVKDGAFVRLR